MKVLVLNCGSSTLKFDSQRQMAWLGLASSRAASSTASAGWFNSLDSQKCEAVPANFADAAKDGRRFAITFQVNHGMPFAGFDG